TEDDIADFLLNTPDFFGRARAYECARVFLAERGGEIAGSAAVTVRDVLVGGRLERGGYEFQFFTTPEFRRQGVAQALRAAIEAWLRA
ncbi:GNAT family N-acetyltransferase, partial [Citrobacter sp. AAK_AS5]